jgi:hypothetical protein
VKDRVVAEDGVLDHGSEGRGHNDAGEHGLVQVADQLFKREGDGGDGRIEGGGDARRHADRGHAPAVLGAEPGSAGQHAADAGADLHRGPFKAQRSAGADLQAQRMNLPIVSRTVTRPERRA